VLALVLAASMLSAGASVALAVVPTKEAQKITFTSAPPSSATVGGPTYNVTATGGPSGNPVAFTIDSTSASVCTITGATVSFTSAGICTVDANQAGNSQYKRARQAQQSFAVGRGVQTATFTSTAPASATVGGVVYNVTATGGPSGNPVTLTIDSASTSVCTISGSTVGFIGAGRCTIDANQAGNANYEPAPQAQQSFAVGAQTIAFTSAAASNAAVGSSYAVTATGGGSGNPVTFTIDSASTSVCTISGSTVGFIGAGRCTIDANQAGNANYEPAPQAQQSVTVGRGAQVITFFSMAPSNAAVGGSYALTAAGGGSGNPVTFTSDPATQACAISGETVYFVGTGQCVIDANQAGDSNYEPAPQAQQSFVVAAASEHQIIVAPSGTAPSSGTLSFKQVGSAPDSRFSVIGASLNLATYSITLVESVADPGVFSWVLTFENGKFGTYAANTKRCKTGSVRLKGECRPTRIVFARGSETVATVGRVSFTVRPTSAGIAALRRAFKRHKGLPVKAQVTFQSSRGGSPVARTQALLVTLTR
jgi:hypothetical protein